MFWPWAWSTQQKQIGSIGHIQKLCKLFPQAWINLKSAMLNMHANAGVSEQQNCSYSMWKLARDLVFGPLDCARSALHAEPYFIFVRLWMKFVLSRKKTFVPPDILHVLAMSVAVTPKVRQLPQGGGVSRIHTWRARIWVDMVEERLMPHIFIWT